MSIPVIYTNSDGVRSKLRRNASGFWESITESQPIEHESSITIMPPIPPIKFLSLDIEDPNHWFEVDDIELLNQNDFGDKYNIFIRDIKDAVFGNPQVYGEFIELPNKISDIVVPVNEYMTHDTFNTILSKMGENYKFIIDKSSYINVPPNGLAFRYGPTKLPNDLGLNLNIWQQLDFGHYLDWRYTPTDDQDANDFKSIAATDDYMIFADSEKLTVSSVTEGLNPSIQEREYYIYGNDKFTNILTLDIDSLDRVWVLDEISQGTNTIGHIGIFSFDNGKFKFETIWSEDVEGGDRYLKNPTDLKISDGMIYIPSENIDGYSTIKKYTESSALVDEYIMPTDTVNIINITITVDFVIALGSDNNLYRFDLVTTEYIEFIDLTDKILSYLYTDNIYDVSQISKLANNSNGIFFYGIAGNLIYKFNQLGHIVETFGETVVNIINTDEELSESSDTVYDNNIRSVYHDSNFNLYVSSDYDIIKYLDRAEIDTMLLDNESFNVYDDNWGFDDIIVDSDENATAWVYNRVFDRIYDQLAIFRLSLKGSLALITSSPFERVVVDNFTPKNYPKLPHKKSDIFIGINELHCEAAINRCIIQLNDCFEATLGLLNIRDKAIDPDILHIESFSITNKVSTPLDAPLYYLNGVYYVDKGVNITSLSFAWKDNMYYRKDNKLRAHITDNTSVTHRIVEGGYAPLEWDDDDLNLSGNPEGNQKYHNWTLTEEFGGIEKSIGVNLGWLGSIYAGTIPDEIDLSGEGTSENPIELERGVIAVPNNKQFDYSFNNNTNIETFTFDINVSNGRRYYIAIPADDFDSIRIGLNIPDDVTNQVEREYYFRVGEYTFEATNKKFIKLDGVSDYYILFPNLNDPQYTTNTDSIGFSLTKNYVDGGELPTPTGLTASRYTFDSASISWNYDTSVTVDSWILERKDPSESFEYLTTLNGDIRTYIDDGLTTGATYSYRILGIKGFVSTEYSNEDTVTIIADAIATPELISAVHYAQFYVKLIWDTDNTTYVDHWELTRTYTDGTETVSDIINIYDITKRSHTDHIPKLDIEYTYHINGVRITPPLMSDDSNDISVTASPDVIVAPTELIAVSHSQYIIDLAWVNNAINEKTWHIDRSDDNKTTWNNLTSFLSTSVNTDYSDTSVALDTDYDYRVYASNDYTSSTAVLSTPSPVRSTADDIIAPDPLIASSTNERTVDLVWTDLSQNETKWNIYRGPNAATLVYLDVVNSADVESYTDYPVDDNVAYVYGVRALNSINQSDMAISESITTIPDSIPTPTLNASPSESLSITLTWNPNNIAGVDIRKTQWVIERKIEPASYITFETINDITTVEYIDTGLDAGTEYTYRIRGERIVAPVDPIHPNIESEWAEDTATPLTDSLDSPTNLQAVQPVFIERIDLTWDYTDTNIYYWTLTQTNTTTGAITTILNRELRSIVDHSYTDTDVEFNNTYKYKLFGESIDGFVTSHITSNTVAVEAESINKPENFTATWVSQGQVQLAWRDTSHNETRWNIERKDLTLQGDDYTTVHIGQSTTGPDVDVSVAHLDVSFDDSHVGKVFSYRVRAENDYMVSDWTVMNILVFLAPDPIAKPINFNAELLSQSEISLTWVDNSTNETGFMIQRAIYDPDRSNDAQIYDKNIYTTSISTITTGNGYTITESAFGSNDINTTYIYRILAQNTFTSSPFVYLGDDLDDDGEDVIILEPDPIAKPTNLIAYNAWDEVGQTEERNYLNWENNPIPSNAIKLEIEYKFGNMSYIPLFESYVMTQSSYIHTSVIANQIYSYRIRNVGEFTESEWEEKTNILVIPVPVITPSNLTAIYVNESAVDLQWIDQSYNERKWRIERSVDGTTTYDTYTDISTTTGVGTVKKYKDRNGLTKGLTYHYRVSAGSSYTESDWSDEVSIYTTPNDIAQPINLTAVRVSNNTIRLNWDDMSDNETYWRVARYEEDDTHPNFIIINAEDLLTPLGYLDTGLKSSTRYRYYVQGVNENTATYSPYSNEAVAITTPDTLTPPPTLSVESTTINSITVNWDDDTVFADIYKLEYNTTGTTGFVFLANVTGNDGTLSYTHDGLVLNQIVSYRVRGVYNTTSYSDYSNTVTASVVAPTLTAPVILAGIPTRYDDPVEVGTELFIRIEYSDTEPIYNHTQVLERHDGTNWVVYHEEYWDISEPHDNIIPGDYSPTQYFYIDGYPREYYTNSYRMKITTDWGESLYSETFTVNLLPYRIPNMYRPYIEPDGLYGATIEWGYNPITQGPLSNFTEFTVQRRVKDTDHSTYIDIGTVGRYAGVPVSEGGDATICSLKNVFATDPSFGVGDLLGGTASTVEYDYRVVIKTLMQERYSPYARYAPMLKLTVDNTSTAMEGLYDTELISNLATEFLPTESEFIFEVSAPTGGTVWIDYGDPADAGEIWTATISRGIERYSHIYPNGGEYNIRIHVDNATMLDFGSNRYRDITFYEYRDPELESRIGYSAYSVRRFDSLGAHPLTTMSDMLCGHLNMQRCSLGMYHAGFSTKSVTDMTAAFKGIGELRTNVDEYNEGHCLLDLSESRFHNVISYKEIFSYARIGPEEHETSLGFIVYGEYSYRANMLNLSFANATITYMAFHGAYYSGRLELSRAEKLINVSYMFAGFNTTELTTELDLREWDLTEITSFNGMFARMGESIESVRLPANCINTNKPSTWGMFESSYIKHIDLSFLNNMQPSKTMNMFIYCSELESCDIGEIDFSENVSCNHMFCGCHVLQHLDFSETTWKNPSTGMSKNTNVTAMFKNCYDLEIVGLDKIGAEHILYSHYTFSNCQTFSNHSDLHTWNFSSVEDVSYLFYNNLAMNLNRTKLTDWTFAKMDLSSVITANGMFAGCENIDYLGPLQTTWFQYFDTDGVEGGKPKLHGCVRMFKNCKKLRVLDFSGDPTDPVTDPYIYGNSQYGWKSYREGTHRPYATEMYAGCESLSGNIRYDLFFNRDYADYLPATLGFCHYESGPLTRTKLNNYIFSGIFLDTPNLRYYVDKNNSHGPTADYDSLKAVHPEWCNSNYDDNPLYHMGYCFEKEEAGFEDDWAIFHNWDQTYVY